MSRKRWLFFALAATPMAWFIYPAVKGIYATLSVIYAVIAYDGVSVTESCANVGHPCVFVREEVGFGLDEVPTISGFWTKEEAEEGASHIGHVSCTKGAEVDFTWPGTNLLRAHVTYGDCRLIGVPPDDFNVEVEDRQQRARLKKIETDASQPSRRP